MEYKADSLCSNLWWSIARCIYGAQYSGSPPLPSDHDPSQCDTDNDWKLPANAGPIGHGWYSKLDGLAARFVTRGTPQFILSKVISAMQYSLTNTACNFS